MRHNPPEPRHKGQCIQHESIALQLDVRHWRRRIRSRFPALRQVMQRLKVVHDSKLGEKSDQRHEQLIAIAAATADSMPAALGKRR